MPEKLAVLGASVRAAAFSALRAGFLPVCADRFADLDLRRRVPIVQVDHYPNGLAEAILREPVDGWFYTGALENYPDLVDRIAASRPLLGVPGEKLAAVRDPFRLADGLAAEGISFPPIESAGDGLPVDGSWLRKPKRGGGGAGISAWRGGRSSPAAGDAGRCTSPDYSRPNTSPKRKRGSGNELPSLARRASVAHPASECPGTHLTAGSPAWFFQKRVTGRPCSAVFVGDGNDSVLLGATWQLVGTPWTGAGEFGYAGSLGPVELSRHVRSQWERVGQVLTRRFGLIGLFGVDAVLDNDTLWPVEVNPRYTASVEVLERAFEVDAIRVHVDVCRGGRLPRSPGRAARAWCGKAILYAREDLRVPPAWERFAEEAISAWPWPELADVPAAGTRIRARSPVATVLTEASGEQAVYDLLRSRAEEVERLLYPAAAASSSGRPA